MMEESNPVHDHVYEVVAQPLSQNNECVNIEIKNNRAHRELELYEKILEIEKDSNHIICLCLLDFFLNMLYLSLYYYHIFINLICFIIGYRGASKRHSGNIKCYMIYQSVQVGTKVLFFFFLIDLKTNTRDRIEYRIHNPHNLILGNIDSIIVYTIFNIYFSIYFSCYLRKYYNLLPYLKINPNYVII